MEGGGRAGALADLVPSDGYPVAFADRPTERFGTTTAIFPANLLSVIQQSETVRWGDFAAPSEGRLDRMRHDPDVTLARIDGIDFLRFAEERTTSTSMVETVLRPFGDTTLNRIEALSAAEALRFFDFYLMGNPERLGFDHLARDPMSSVVDRLAARMRTLGVRLRTGTPASRVDTADGRVTGVRVVGVAPGGAAITLPAAGVGPAWTEVRDADGAPVFVARRADGLLALFGRCPHKGCPVAPDTTTGGFRCPCYGGRFSADGVVTLAPRREPGRRSPPTGAWWPARYAVCGA